MLMIYKFQANPLVKMKSISISDCEVTGQKVDKFATLHNINDNGDKALDFTLDLPNDMDLNKATVRQTKSVIITQKPQRSV